MLNGMMAILIATGAAAHALSQPDILERVIESTVPVYVGGPNDCDLRLGLSAIARTTGVPAGLEVARDRSTALGNRTDIRGSSLRDALDQLRACDAAYEWRVVNGVIVMRPKSSWSSTDHLLNRPVPEFTLADAGLRQAVAEVHRLWFRDAVYDPSIPEPSTIRLSVRLAHATVLDVLNAIAKQGGGLMWIVESPPHASVPGVTLRAGRGVAVASVPGPGSVARH